MRLWARELEESARPAGMAYFGDVNDSPPAWIRVVLAGACLVAAALLFGYLALNAQVVPAILTVAAIILAVYLVAVVPTGAQVALVTVGFWAFIAGLILFWPLAG